MPLSDGLYYAYSNGGLASQPPIVLIHGAGSDHLVWPAQLRRLRGWNVITVDLPGHGRSDGTALQSIEAYANSLLAFFDRLKIYQVILAGHSMGGAIAQTLARLYPQRVAGLALLACGANLNGAIALSELLCNPVTRSLAYQQLENNLFARGADVNLVNRTLQALKKVRTGVLYADWLACARFESSQWVSEINVPVWVAVGAQDRFTPPGASIFLAERMNHARLQVIERAGHMVLLEQPEKTARTLAGWLDELFR